MAALVTDVAVERMNSGMGTLNITDEANCWHKQEVFTGRGGLGGTGWAGCDREK